MTSRSLARGIGGAVLAAVLGGCGSTSADWRGAGGSAASGSIPHVTPLYRQIADTHVHRFRKPIRDEHARLARELAVACDDLIARTAAWDRLVPLTSTQPADWNTLRADIATLRRSLAALRDAARTSHAGGMQRAHDRALAAYERIRGRMRISDL